MQSPGGGAVRVSEWKYRFVSKEMNMLRFILRVFFLLLLLINVSCCMVGWDEGWGGRGGGHGGGGHDRGSGHGGGGHDKGGGHGDRR